MYRCINLPIRPIRPFMDLYFFGPEFTPWGPEELLWLRWRCIQWLWGGAKNMWAVTNTLETYGVYTGDEILPSLMGIVMYHYKDPY